MPPEPFLQPSDNAKSKEQLIRELAELRRQLAARDQQIAARENAGPKSKPRTEMELKQSEPRLRLLYENAPLAYQSLDETGRFVEVNRAWLDIMGYTRDEVIGRSFVEFLHPDWRPHFKENFPRFKAVGEVLGVEFEMLKKDGSLILASFTGKIGKDSGGNLLQTHCIFEDITDRRRMEMELRESEAKYRTLYENMAQGVFYQASDGTLVDVNRSALEMFGLTRDQFLRRTSYHPEWKVVTEDGVELPPEKHPSMVALRSGKAVMNAVLGVYNPRRRAVIWMSINAVPQFRPSEADPFQVFVTLHDLTEQKRAEEEQKTLRAKLANAIDMARLGPWEYDVAADTFLFNDHFYKLFRTTAEDVGGYEMTSAEYARRFLHSGDANIVESEIRKAIETSDPHFSGQLDHRIICADGEVGHITVRFFIERDANGRIVKTYGVNQDITERKMMEDALAKRENYLKTILHTTADGFWEVDAQGNIKEVNDAYCRMSGYTREELLDSSIGVLNPFAKPHEIAARIARIRANGSEMFETRHRRKDGTIFDVEMSITYMDAQGGRFVCFCRDISKRVRSEAALAHSHNLMRYVLEHNRSAVAVHDRDLNYIYVSRRYLDEYQVKENDIIGKHHYEVFPDIPRKWRDVHQRALKGEIISAEDDPYEREDGTVAWTRWECRPWYEQDNSIGGIIVYTEVITERKNLEAQLRQAQKMESVGRLAGGVAHDFNNKLGVILGNVEMALEDLGDSSTAVRDYLAEIDTAARQAGDLTRQLLAFARKQTIVPKVIDVNETIAGMLKMLHRLIGEDIELAWSPGDGLWPVKMDPSQVDQILANFCVNARDAIPGAGIINIETGNATFEADDLTGSSDLVPGQYVMVAVSDNGCGMSRETQEHIFEPFFTTKDLGRGTGLGLSTVYGIVKQNRGFIHLSSEPGQGATFKIYVPRYERGKGEDARGGLAGPLPSGHETILLVEDEPAILKVVDGMLTRLGYDVVAARTATEAMQLATGHGEKIQLMLTDVIMPEMNGRDLVGKIQTAHPGVKVLYMSGYTADVIAQHGVLEEGVDYIQKPFSTHGIAEKIREVLDRKAA